MNKEDKNKSSTLHDLFCTRVLLTDPHCHKIIQTGFDHLNISHNPQWSTVLMHDILLIISKKQDNKYFRCPNEKYTCKEVKGKSYKCLVLSLKF